MNNFMRRQTRMIARTVDETASRAVELLRESHGAPVTQVEDAALETFDYDNANDYHREDKQNALIGAALKFAMTVLIAFVTAILMYLVSAIVKWASAKRIDNTVELIETGYTVSAFFSFFFISLVLTGVASFLCTVIAPQARGGGVPYLFAYLNGTNVAHFFTFRIVSIKVIALAFTIAGGLTLGMEGPFVYIGGGVALLLSKMIDFIPVLGNNSKYSRIIRNIKEERIFMAGGLAAGLAVAFNAPIAGILFAMEGATSFMTVPVVIRIFACSMFALFFKDIASSGWSQYIRNDNLITIEYTDTPYAWYVAEIVAFTILALIGGALGAVAVHLNVQITKWRHHYMNDRIKANMIEVALITVVTASIQFALPVMFGCHPMPPLCADPSEQRCRQLFCPNGEYSQIGSLIFSSSDVITRNLFDRTIAYVPGQIDYQFDPFPLLVYMIAYVFLVAWVYGAYVPGGLFVPSIVIGAVYGRVVGYFIQHYVSAVVNPGVYALLGAAGMLGGFTRLGLPVIIMLVEMTGDATYLLPIMYVATLAKLLSDYVEPPLYPQHMLIEGIPQLGDKIAIGIATLTAAAICNKSAARVHERDTLGHVLDVLDQSKAALMPVVDKNGHFEGMISRQLIIYALKYTRLYSSVNDAIAAELEQVERQAERHQRSGSDAASESGVNVQSDWHATNDPSATLNRFDDRMLTYLIALTPFVDKGAFSVNGAASAKRVHALFRRVGLSHLAVVDNNNVLIGVCTRRSLLQMPKPQNTTNVTADGGEEAADVATTSSAVENGDSSGVAATPSDTNNNDATSSPLSTGRSRQSTTPRLLRRQSTVQRIAAHVKDVR